MEFQVVNAPIFGSCIIPHLNDYYISSRWWHVPSSVMHTTPMILSTPVTTGTQVIPAATVVSMLFPQLVTFTPSSSATPRGWLRWINDLHTSRFHAYQTWPVDAQRMTWENQHWNWLVIASISAQWLSDIRHSAFYHMQQCALCLTCVSMIVFW